MRKYNFISMNIILIALFVYTKIFATDTPVTIYTPEGQAVTAYIMGTGSLWYDDEDALDDITKWSLDAEIIETSTRSYNCHGYAWAITEDIGGIYWIGYVDNDEEVKFFSDGSYSNDGVPSYIQTTIAPTHACYEPNSDHSVRVIQNGYPVSSSGSKTHVSKWACGPLVRHAPGHDIFALTNTSIISYYKLKTDHYGTLTSGNKKWIGAGGITHRLTDNVLVPSGTTLNLLTGATLNLNNKYIRSTGGQIFGYPWDLNFIGNYVHLLNSSGGVKGIFPNIQTAVNYATAGDEILISPGTFTETVYITDKDDIELYGDGEGITIINGSISLTNSQTIAISNLTIGSIQLNNGSDADFSYLTVTSSTISSDYNNSNISLYHITAENLGASFGVRSYGGTGYVNHCKIQNGDCAIYVGSNSTYEVSTSNEFCNNGYDIDAAQSGASAHATSNQYSRSLPSAVYGNVQTDGTNTVCGMSKIIVDNVLNSEVSPELQALDDIYLLLLEKIRKDKEEKKYDPQKYNQEKDQLLSEYGNLVKEGNPRWIIKAALSKINHLYKWRNDKDGFYNFIKQLLSASKSDSFQPYLKRYLIWENIDNNHYDYSIKIADEILSSDISNNLKAEMLFEKGLIYKYYIDDISSAEASFNEIIKKYPESELVHFAEIQLNNNGSSLKNIRSEEETQSTASLIFDCSNYPNPANPTTTIYYTLPHNSDVEIKIFDIMGREIKSFNFFSQNQGHQNIVWDSKNNLGETVSSGIYIYSVKAKSLEEYGRIFEKSKKLLLLK